IGSTPGTRLTQFDPGPSPMRIIDFSRSFLTFRIDWQKKPSQTGTHAPPYSLNNARIVIECRCRIRDRETGTLHSFVMGASCKTERVGVEGGIWLEPNADFVPIFSDDRFLHIKTYARCGIGVELYPPGTGVQSDRQSGNIADAFDSVRIDVVETEGELLKSAHAIVEATLANRPLVARTEIAQGQYEAVLEFPVKTMNANERAGIYQTDTGPVLLPDFERVPADLINGMQLAYAAFNCPSWIELIVRAPTPVGDGFEVYHYSRPVRFDARNTLSAMAPTS
ncbi:MAG: hypothetical protein WD648_02500, partial [Planctomycetaceae bacterium]